MAFLFGNIYIYEKFVLVMKFNSSKRGTVITDKHTFSVPKISTLMYEPGHAHSCLFPTLYCRKMQMELE